MSNSLFDKTTENVKKHQEGKHVINEKRKSLFGT